MKACSAFVHSDGASPRARLTRVVICSSLIVLGISCATGRPADRAAKNESNRPLAAPTEHPRTPSDALSELAHQVYQDACIDPPRAIALLDDFDGDGVLEIAVGRPDDASLGAATGAVVVLNGASGREMLRIEGDSPHGAFGRAVVAVGDLDGDSLRDLAVGAPAWGVKGETGSVRLVSSRTGALLGTLTTDEPFDNRFGAALDFDASANRLIVGVQGGYSRHNSSDYGGIDVFEVSSRVRVLRVRFASEHCYCELRAAEWGLDIDGPYGLGRGVRAWHDVDGDGIDEFFAAGVDTLNGSRVYLFSGADGHILRLWDE